MRIALLLCLSLDLSQTHADEFLEVLQSVSYMIDERNVERQQMLAKVLNPLTREVLDRIPKIKGGRCLDLGCGQGNTTRFLQEVLQPGEIIGLEYDASLVEYATSRRDNAPGVQFQQGDAAKLPFPDASFDVVFTRYLLFHLPEPLAVIREMLRVVRPSGRVVAYEPDLQCVEISYPPSSAPAFMNRAWNGLFAEPHMGRKLARLTFAWRERLYCRQARYSPWNTTPLI